MYLNHKKIKELSLTANDVLLFDALRQFPSNPDLEEIVAYYIRNDQRIDEFIENGVLKRIKGKPNQTDIQKLRIDKKGTEYLKLIQEADVNEFCIQLRDWVVDLYSKQEKTTKNKKKLAWQIAQFEANTGIQKNHLAFLISVFTNDDENMEYNHVSNYMFEDPKNVFFKGFRKEDSRLFHYYLKRKNYFENKFKTLKNK